MKNGRKITITYKNKEIIDTKGLSVSEVKSCLKDSRIISVFESNEKESNDENKDK